MRRRSDTPVYAAQRQFKDRELASALWHAFAELGMVDEVGSVEHGRVLLGNDEPTVEDVESRWVEGPESRVAEWAAAARKLRRRLKAAGDVDLRDKTERQRVGEPPDLLGALGADATAPSASVVGVQLALDGGDELELVRTANGELSYRRPGALGGELSTT
jgi:hypothetical protein